MATHPEFHNLHDRDSGIVRQLSAGMAARIFPGDQAMISIVEAAPHSEGKLHHHPEEQWGVMLEGSGVRVQGDHEIPVKKGDFWRTPANVPHTLRAGPEGCRVLDIFAPPRAEYRRAGSGFGND
jgi:quercetin dioxygenase-like cupin family protein